MKDLPAETVITTVYRLGDITYVPHYRNKEVFVSPGYPQFTKNLYSSVELLFAGAKPESIFLWDRTLVNPVDARNL